MSALGGGSVGGRGKSVTMCTAPGKGGGVEGDGVGDAVVAM